VKVVRCLLRAGVGHEAVVGVCPVCWGPPGDTVPRLLLPVVVGSGLSFLNAPSGKSDITHFISIKAGS
jgi:hypothetical protein